MILLEELCLALSVFGSIPEGNLLLEIHTDEVKVQVYTQEDKRKVYNLLCSTREIGE